MKTILSVLTSTRFKSFYWRTAMMVLAVIITAIAQNLDLVSPYVSPAVVTVFGLILGEISKGLSNWLKEE